MTNSLFVFGLGYSTTAVARQAQQRGWNVTSTARRPEGFAALTSSNHKVVKFNPGTGVSLDEDALVALQSAQYVLTSIPPVAAKLYDPVLAAQHKVLRQVMTTGRVRPALGYLSSTGVYGDWGGAWVDESAEARTVTGRGLLRREAEEAWEQLAVELGLQLTIFRLGGIYGPHRSVLSGLQAKAPARPSAVRRSRQRFTSRCHVADVARAVLADMVRAAAAQQQQQQQQPPQQLAWGSAGDAAQGQCVGGAGPAGALVDIVNVVDDEPAPRADVEAYARHLLGCDSPGDAAHSGGDAQQQPPPLQQQQQQQGRLAEPLEEKRVRNAKLKQLLQEQLGVGLVAPTYREGLALVHSSTTPFEQVDLQCLFHGGRGAGT